MYFFMPFLLRDTENDLNKGNEQDRSRAKDHPF